MTRSARNGSLPTEYGKFQEVITANTARSRIIVVCNRMRRDFFDNVPVLDDASIFETQEVASAVGRPIHVETGENRNIDPLAHHIIDAMIAQPRPWPAACGKRIITVGATRGVSGVRDEPAAINEGV